MQARDKLYSILFSVGSDKPVRAEAEIIKITEKRVYLEHKTLPVAPPFETKPFSLRQVAYVTLGKSSLGLDLVDGGYASSLGSVRAAIASLHEEQANLSKRMLICTSRQERLEELRKQLLDEQDKQPFSVQLTERGSGEIGIAHVTQSTRCQEVLIADTGREDLPQCLLPAGHEGEHDFRPDTAAVWSEMPVPDIQVAVGPEAVDAALACDRHNSECRCDPVANPSCPTNPSSPIDIEGADGQGRR